MTFNKWTLGLAALGAVSLTSVAQAEEKMLLGSQAELTSTTISGYVSASAAWDFGRYSELANTRGYSYSAGKGDGFNLDVVDLTLEKALDESEWAAGYKAEFWFGPDAAGIGSQFSGTGDVAIKQAYVSLRTPLGNGIDWKIGVFDTIIGYESSNAGDNPNYTRSWGYTIEPTQHTGILGNYRFSDAIAVSFGVANTWNATINGRDSGNVDDSKAFMAAISLTAPESFGFLHGGSLYAGIVSGKQSGAVVNQSFRNSYYVGATVPTPVEGLKAGVSFDYLDLNEGSPAFNTSSSSALAGYLSFAATEKLTLHTRVDYLQVGGDGVSAGGGSVAVFAPGSDILSTTLTADYQLWKNVISRVEFRWDHDLDEGGDQMRGGGVTGHTDEMSLLANVIYKF
ncbi:MAG: outer membrane beta-barrel protein [Verrucomicrobiota bacterium]